MARDLIIGNNALVKTLRTRLRLERNWDILLLWLTKSVVRVVENIVQVPGDLLAQRLETKVREPATSRGKGGRLN